MANFLSRSLLLATLLAALASGANAQTGSAQSKSSLINEINTNFPTQNVGAITPTIMRQGLLDLLASSQQYTAVNAQTGTSYTIQTSDYGQLVTFNNASPVAVTLLQGTSGNGFFPFNLYVSNIGTGTITVTPTVSTINGGATLTVKPGASAQIISDGTNYQATTSGAVTSVNGVPFASSYTTGQPLVFNGSAIASAVLGVPGGGTGQTSFTAGLPILGNGTSGFTQGSIDTNGGFATLGASPVNGQCAGFNSLGKVVPEGGPCTTSGGGGTVTAATAGQFAFYQNTGSVVVGQSTMTFDTSGGNHIVNINGTQSDVVNNGQLTFNDGTGRHCSFGAWAGDSGGARGGFGGGCNASIAWASVIPSTNISIQGGYNLGFSFDTKVNGQLNTSTANHTLTGEIGTFTSGTHPAFVNLHLENWSAANLRGASVNWVAQLYLDDIAGAIGGVPLNNQAINLWSSGGNNVLGAPTTIANGNIGLGAGNKLVDTDFGFAVETGATPLLKYAARFAAPNSVQTDDVGVVKIDSQPTPGNGFNAYGLFVSAIGATTIDSQTLPVTASIYIPQPVVGARNTTTISEADSLLIDNAPRSNGAGGTLSSAFAIHVKAGLSQFDGTLATTVSPKFLSTTSIPAGGTTGIGALLSSVTNFGVFFGSGVPTLSAAKGSLYLRSDGTSTSTRVYINTDGGTTWTAITTAS